LLRFGDFWESLVISFQITFTELIFEDEGQNVLKDFAEFIFADTIQKRFFQALHTHIFFQIKL